MKKIVLSVIIILLHVIMKAETEFPLYEHVNESASEAFVNPLNFKIEVEFYSENLTIKLHNEISGMSIEKNIRKYKDKNLNSAAFDFTELNEGDFRMRNSQSDVLNVEISDAQNNRLAINVGIDGKVYCENFPEHCSSSIKTNGDIVFNKEFMDDSTKLEVDAHNIIMVALPFFKEVTLTAKDKILVYGNFYAQKITLCSRKLFNHGVISATESLGLDVGKIVHMGVIFGNKLSINAQCLKIPNRLRVDMFGMDVGFGFYGQIGGSDVQITTHNGTLSCLPGIYNHGGDFYSGNDLSMIASQGSIIHKPVIKCFVGSDDCEVDRPSINADGRVNVESKEGFLVGNALTLTGKKGITLQAKKNLVLGAYLAKIHNQNVDDYGHSDTQKEKPYVSKLNAEDGPISLESFNGSIQSNGTLLSTPYETYMKSRLGNYILPVITQSNSTYIHAIKGVSLPFGSLSVRGCQEHMKRSIFETKALELYTDAENIIESVDVRNSDVLNITSRDITVGTSTLKNNVKFYLDNTLVAKRYQEKPANYLLKIPTVLLHGYDRIFLNGLSMEGEILNVCGYSFITRGLTPREQFVGLNFTFFPIITESNELRYQYNYRINTDTTNMETPTLTDN